VPDFGDVFRLAELVPLAGDDKLYFGGVMYLVPGVAGGVLEASRPKSARCVGVSGMSDRSSLGRKSGNRAMTILITKRTRRTPRKISGAFEGYSINPDR
jgi:hypothetical protein